MDKDELYKSLEALQEEINRLEVSDEAGRERIKHLISDLEIQIENPDDSEQTETLVNKIPKLIEHFEVEHPRITETLNRIMVTLSDMGI